jgi:hypothetical protein
MTKLCACVLSLCTGFSVLAACGDTTVNPNQAGDTSADAGPSTGADANDSRGREAGSARAVLDPELALRAAVFVGSCLPDDRSNRYLQRMYDEVESDDELELIGALPCFATKTNGCEAVAECLGYTVATVASCTAGCDGDVVVACDDEVEFREDCAFKGLSCVLAGDRPTCAPAGTTFTPCDYGTFTEACEDGKPTYCLGERGKGFGPKCSDHGLSCDTVSATATDTFVCKGPDGDCQVQSYGPGSARYVGIACNGASLEACANGGKTTVSCGSVATGFTCQDRGETKFCGLAAACEPGTIANQPTCEGTSLVVCNAGKTTKVDCTTLGFTGCNAQAGACTPSPWGP